jgi:hypothetical protein
MPGQLASGNAVAALDHDGTLTAALKLSGAGGARGRIRAHANARHDAQIVANFCSDTGSKRNACQPARVSVRISRAVCVELGRRRRCIGC